jgi:PAS domain S-box-containing protein
MKVNKLLQTQIRRYLPADALQGEQMINFLNEVSNTYSLYQEELKPAAAILAHAMDTAEPPPVFVPKAVNEKRINKDPAHLALIETINERAISPTDDLTEQIHERRKAEAALKNSEELLSTVVTRLTHLITNLNNGILLEDETGRIILANELFCENLGIDAAPETMIGTAGKDCVQQTRHLVKDPVTNMERIASLLAEKKSATGDELHLVDGRILTRDYIPLFVSNEYKGHLWKYEDVTREKENQQALQRLSLVASANENGVAFSDDTGTILWANEGFTKLTGYSYEEMIGQNAIHLGIGPLSNRDTIGEMADLFLAGKNFTLEVIHYRKDQTWFWARITGQSIRYWRENVSEYFAIVEDITQEKEKEEQLRVLSLIAEENLNSVIIMDAMGTITWVNKSFVNITGYTHDEAKGKIPGDFLYGEATNPDTVQYIRKAISEGESFNCELLIYTKSGAKAWLRLQGQALRNEQGELTGFFSLEEDITNDIENKRKIKEYESRFRKAFEKIGDNVWEHDFSTDVTYFSNTKSHLLGYEINEFTGNKKLWWDRTHADDKIILQENNAKYLRGEIDHHILEYRVLHRDGSIRWVMDRGVVIEKDAADLPLKVIGTHTDITERKQAEELLQTKEEKYRSIIANMNLGLMEVDTDENILFSNQSFCDMSGYDYDELIGKRASNIFSKGENIELMESKNEARKKSGADAYEIAVKDKRGQLRWWLMSGATRYNESGELVGSIGIYLDITDQKQLEIDLIAAREQAEESTRSKEVFLANMSHEIRTPMNAILGMAQQLAKTKLDSKQLFYLDTINSASENLLVIINDILDLSKIEAGKLNLENIGFEPKAVISRAMQVLIHKAEEKGLSITNSKFDTGLSAVLLGDPYRLNQVLLNLISNAIKFTEKGGVDLSCSVVNDTPLTQTIFVEVKDSGIGMDEHFVKNLFEKFSQEDLSVTRQYGGTGLGMSICKDLIELMGGEIMVQSTKGVGTTISFVVELAKGSLADLPSKQNIFINNDMLANKRILVVDDNNMNRLVAKTILNNYGAITSEAVNGKEAIELLMEKEMDLVLMDIQMPVMDGMEATKIIRRDISATIPMIALTANAIKGDNDKCIAVGMNAYLSKPFKEEDLLKTVGFWLGEGKASFIPLADDEETEANNLYDLAAIRAISRGNENFVIKMVNMFVEQTPVQVAQMELHYHHSDYKSMAAIAHKIRPSIDNMGIVSLKEAIREIERIGKTGLDADGLAGLLQQVSTVLRSVIESLQEEFLLPVS